MLSLLSTDDEDLNGGKYNYNPNQEFKGNSNWRDSKGNKILVERKQLNTYSPFHQNQGGDVETEEQGRRHCLHL